jgi:proline iminopeptidase
VWGPTDYYATGACRGYERAGDLVRLAMPVLYACGRHDGSTPETNEWYRTLTPRGELVVFEKSAHMPMNEEPAAFVATVREFLRRVEETG